MWPWRDRPKPLEAELAKLTPEDLQVLSKAITEHPEYVKFWIGLRDNRRRMLEHIPLPKTQEECFAYAMKCRDLSRDCALLTRIIEMPISAAKALERIKHKPERKDTPEAQPWDAPDVPEEDI